MGNIKTYSENSYIYKLSYSKGIDKIITKIEWLRSVHKTGIKIRSWFLTEFEILLLSNKMAGILARKNSAFKEGRFQDELDIKENKRLNKRAQSMVRLEELKQNAYLDAKFTNYWM